MGEIADSSSDLHGRDPYGRGGSRGVPGLSHLREYTPASGPAWIEVRLQEGELSYWRKRNGGPDAVSLPELGKDAFVNPDFEGSADLYAKKGNLVLRVSLPQGPKAVDTAKAIAKKALVRL